MGKQESKEKAASRTTKSGSAHLIWKNCAIGALDAETDEKLLLSCYVNNGCLDAVRDTNSPQSIILGRTGAGKSASLIILAQTESNVISVDPLDLAFKHIENSTVLSFFNAAGVNLDLFYRLLWRHVLITELLKARYNLKDKSATTAWLDNLVAKIRGDAGRDKALRYLRQWGDGFWLTTETRIKEITSKIESQLEGSISASSVVAKAKLGSTAKLTDTEKAEVVSRGSTVVNQIQLRELGEILDFLRDDVFDDSQRRYFVVLDKLDEEWVTSHIKYKLIRALIEEIKVFRKVSNIKIIIALRDDLLERVYDETRDGGFQEEKYEAYYARIKWTEVELIELITKRINEVFKHKYANVSMDIASLLPSSRKGVSPISYIMERTFDRPRDIISYVNQCLAQAEGRPRISWQVIRDAEEKYSKGRLKSLYDEWLARYPSLQRVAESIQGFTESFTRSAFSEANLNELAAGIAERSHGDDVGKLCESILSPGTNKKLSDLTSASLQLLYHVGMIGVKMSAESPWLWSYRGGEELTQGDMKRAISFRVHRMFHRALRIKSDDAWKWSTSED